MKGSGWRACQTWQLPRWRHMVDALGVPMCFSLGQMPTRPPVSSSAGTLQSSRRGAAYREPSFGHATFDIMDSKSEKLSLPA